LSGCVAASYALAPSIGLNWRQGILIGLVGGVLGQYGDLLESAIKRVFDAKDSGWIMPGHGGLLDRLDSILLPALPIAALILFYR
jgi:phosphatidate cytidylyltransferase